MSVLWLTGGSRGIGAATARIFAADGWDIAFCCHRSADAAQSLREELEQTGVRAVAVACDVSDLAQVQSFAQTAFCTLGPPDALVCNAGIALPIDVLTNVSEEDWRRVFAVNVDGVFHAVQVALPHFLRSKRGSIVTLGSMWGQTGGSCEVAYSAAKGAVIAMTRALARELGPSGIRVNCVSPGVIATDMNAALSSEDLDALAEETPLGRIGTPEEAAACIHFLCTDAAAFVTGQVLAPNGGIVI